MAPTILEPEVWHRMMENGDMDRWLDIITDTRDPVVLKAQPLVWQDALCRFQGALLTLVDGETHPKARRTITALKNRLPPAIAAFEHPLACIRENYRVGIALLDILGYLGYTTRIDQTLLAPVKRHGIARIAFLTWLDLADYPLDSDELEQVTRSCINNLTILGHTGRPLVARSVAEAGPRTAAKRLRAYYDNPEATGFAFMNISCLAPFLAESDPTFAEQLFEDKTLTKVTQLIWKELSVNPMQTQKGSKVLYSGLGFILRALAQKDRLINPKSIAALADMIRTCNIFELCAVGLYYYVMASRDTTQKYSTFELEHFHDFTQGVTRACQRYPDLLATYIRPYILPFLDHVRDLHGPKPTGEEEYIGFLWLEIVLLACKSSEAELRMEDWKATINLGRIKPRALVGCSWYQCIFNSGEADGATTRVMMLDINCQRAQYCSQYCQKCDWRDGGHKDICRMTKGIGK